MDPVLSRRSIRKYTDKNISKKDIEYLLTAGHAAACARGLRSWQFVVLTEREIMDRVPDFHPYSRMILEAPLAILVCADPSVEPREGYWMQNCSAATENMLIAARSRGIGSVWLGIYPRPNRVKGMMELLKLPEEIIPFSLVVFGYPAEEKEPHTSYDPSRVHWNKW